MLMYVVAMIREVQTREHVLCMMERELIWPESRARTCAKPQCTATGGCLLHDVALLPRLTCNARSCRVKLDLCGLGRTWQQLHGLF